MSPTRKPVPRAVLEDRLKRLEAEKMAKRVAFVKVGAYVAIVLGVLANQAIQMNDDLQASLVALELSQVAGSALIGGLVYTKLEHSKPRDWEGKAKKGNLIRSLLAAFFQGMGWMTLVGAWW